MIIFKFKFGAVEFETQSSADDPINWKSLKLHYFSHSLYQRMFAGSNKETIQLQGDLKFKFLKMYNDKLNNSILEDIHISIFERTNGYDNATSNDDEIFFDGFVKFESIKIREFAVIFTAVEEKGLLHVYEPITYTPKNSTYITTNEPLQGSTTVQSTKDELYSVSQLAIKNKETFYSYEVSEPTEYPFFKVEKGTTKLIGNDIIYNIKKVDNTFYYKVRFALQMEWNPHFIEYFIFNLRFKLLIFNSKTPTNPYSEKELLNSHIIETGNYEFNEELKTYDFDIDVLIFLDTTVSSLDLDTDTFLVGFSVQIFDLIVKLQARDPQSIGVDNTFVLSLKSIQSSVIVNFRVKDKLLFVPSNDLIDEINIKDDTNYSISDNFLVSSLDFMTGKSKNLTFNGSDVITDIALLYGKSITQDNKIVSFDEIFTNKKLFTIDAATLDIEPNDDLYFNAITVGKTSKANNDNKFDEFTDKKTYGIKTLGSDSKELDLSVKSLKMDMTNVINYISQKRQEYIQIAKGGFAIDVSISKKEVNFQDLSFDESDKLLIFDGGSHHDIINNYADVDMKAPTGAKINMLNYTYAPQTILTKWSWLVGIFNQKPTLRSGTLNNDLIVENNSIKTPLIDSKKFITSRILLVDTVLSIKEYLIIKDNLFGYIDFEFEDQLYSGYIDAIEFPLYGKQYSTIRLLECAKGKGVNQSGLGFRGIPPNRILLERGSSIATWESVF